MKKFSKIILFLAIFSILTNTAFSKTEKLDTQKQMIFLSIKETMDSSPIKPLTYDIFMEKLKKRNIEISNSSKLIDVIKNKIKSLSIICTTNINTKTLSSDSKKAEYSITTTIRLSDIINGKIIYKEVQQKTYTDKITEKNTKKYLSKVIDMFIDNLVIEINKFQNYFYTTKFIINNVEQNDVQILKDTLTKQPGIKEIKDISFEKNILTLEVNYTIDKDTLIKEVSNLDLGNKILSIKTNNQDSIYLEIKNK
jgi:hypothetical protein